MARLLGIAEALALAEDEVLDADFDAEAEALELPEAEEWDCVALALAKVLETTVHVNTDNRASTSSRLSGHKSRDPEQ
jgi:hypothetical protein